jgi:hypothetical protein
VTTSLARRRSNSPTRNLSTRAVCRSPPPSARPRATCTPPTPSTSPLPPSPALYLPAARSAPRSRRLHAAHAVCTPLPPFARRPQAACISTPGPALHRARRLVLALPPSRKTPRCRPRTVKARSTSPCDALPHRSAPAPPPTLPHRSAPAAAPQRPAPTHARRRARCRSGHAAGPPGQGSQRPPLLPRRRRPAPPALCTPLRPFARRPRGLHAAHAVCTPPTRSAHRPVGSFSMPGV